jgi:hypothetical protein
VCRETRLAISGRRAGGARPKATGVTATAGAPSAEPRRARAGDPRGSRRAWPAGKPCSKEPSSRPLDARSAHFLPSWSSQTSLSSLSKPTFRRLTSGCDDYSTLPPRASMSLGGSGSGSATAPESSGSRGSFRTSAGSSSPPIRRNRLIRVQARLTPEKSREPTLRGAGAASRRSVGTRPSGQASSRPRRAGPVSRRHRPRSARSRRSPRAGRCCRS